MNKYTFKITTSSDKQITITVNATDSRDAFLQIERVISDVKDFEIVKVESE